MLDVYFDLDGWAYSGVYTKLGNLPGLIENEKCWTMLGAILTELLNSGYFSVKIYHNSRLVDEWEEDISYISRRSISIAARIKNELVPQFINLEIIRLDSHTILREKERLKLT